MPTFFDLDLLHLLTRARAESDSEETHAATRALQKARDDAAEPATAAAAAGTGRRGYFTFIRIDVRHGFFNRSNGICDELDIQPTRETRKRLALFGLMARCRADGIDLLWTYAHRDLAAAKLAPIVDLLATQSPAGREKSAKLSGEQLFGMPLLFTVALANPRFANFTAMPSDFSIGNPPLLLSNRVLEPRKAADFAADLTIDWTRRVERSMPEAEDEDAATPGDSVRAPRDGSARDERRRVDAASRAFALLEVHLVRAPGPAPAPGTWDGMPISLDPDGDRRASAESIFRRCAYTLRFAARETCWRYFVATRDGSEPDTRELAVIEPGGADAGFTLSRERRTLPDGRVAVCLARKAPLPILARPEKLFALRGMLPGGRSRSGTLVRQLQAAGADSISAERAGPARAGKPPPAWSDIYVFV